MSRSELDELVARLPGACQKIYGAPEYDARAMRDCDSRWALLDPLLSSYPKPPRDIRVLDAGCAQGYFALKAAEKGCRALGIDVSEPNLALCRHLSARAGLPADFELRALDEDFLNSVPDGRFDFAFLFGALHHICRERGLAKAQELIALLARKTRCLVAELALKEEPLDWAASLPEDPAELLAPFPFRKKLGESPTRLSDIRRPVYFASGRFCRVEGRFFEFDSVQTKSHDFVGELHRGSRTYFFGKGLVVKEYKLDTGLAGVNRPEAQREKAVLEEYGGKIPLLPPLLAYEADGERIRLARGFKEGELLSSRIASRRPYDAWGVVEDVLKELEALESLRLYHSDLRSWNVVLAPDGRAGLIDFGAVGPERDEDVFEAFITFCWCAANAVQPAMPGVVTARRSADSFPENWRRTVLRITSLPEDALSFRKLREIFADRKDAMADENDLQIKANAENIRRLEDKLNALSQAFQENRDLSHRMSERLEIVDHHLKAFKGSPVLLSVWNLYAALRKFWFMLTKGKTP